jgi:hydroxypyruvate reductase
MAVLSAGTDGIDGNAPAAGAVVDRTTMARAGASGLDVARALAGFDAYPLFQNLGDSVVTGPTGNNVRDLRILLTE